MGSHVRKRCHCNGQATFFIIVLLLLFVSSVGVCAYFYFAKEHMVQLHFDKVDVLNKKIIALSEHIKEKDIANQNLKNSLVLADKELEDLRSKAKENEDLIAQLADLKTIINQQFLQVNDSLSSGFSKIDTFSMTFDSKIENYLNSNKKELTTLLRDGKRRDAVELPPVVVKAKESSIPKSTPKATPASLPDVKYGKINPTSDSAQDKDKGKKGGKEFRVMKVNHKHAFFVVNKGMIDGIKVATPLVIFRHDVKIADALITEVRELVSLARIEKQYEEHFIEEGDSVRFK